MSERNSSKPGVLLWVSCLATAVAVPLLLDSSSEASGERGAERAGPEDPVWRRFEERIARLEQDIRDLEGRSLERPVEREPLQAEKPGPDPLLQELRKRIERLESAGPEWSGSPGSWTSTPALEAIESWPDPELEELNRRNLIEDCHVIILDPSTTDSEKAHAWLELGDLGMEAWTDEVVMLMTQIGATSDDDRAREVVWIGADSSNNNNLLVDPLLQALHDPVANVREEAADALGHYLHMGGVREALHATSQYDDSEKVRSEALRVLGE